VQKRYIWLLKHFRSNHPHGDLKGIHKSDWKALQARLTRLANETKQAPQDLRSYWSFLRHMIKKHEARETTSAHLSWFKQAGLTTTSHVWTTSHFLLLRALWKPKHKPSMDYIRHMASNHPNPGLRGFLWSLLATQLKQQLARHYTRWQASATPAQKKKRAKRLAQAKQRARKWIKQRLPWAHKHNHKQLQQTLSHLQKCASPNQTKGPRPPGFSVPLYPSRKGRRFQNSDLLGHYTLLAFWATWCDTCVDKMPALHNIYQRYKGYGFRIVSLSYDKTWKEVSTFRKGKWAMPWMHTVLTKGFDSKVGTSFGITLIPSQFLIGPDGRIIAQGDKLRGAFFLPTLSRILNRAYHNEMILAPHISRLQKQHQHHQ
jgi:thiol-disulfide isomerase/thioredoxin